MTVQDSPPSSPADRRRIKVRGAILQAAERVFAEEGAEGLSIRRLADEIDYSPAAIYKYFGSKRELLDELKNAFFEQILEQVDDVNNASTDVRARGRACLSVYVHTAIRRPHHYSAAFAGVVEDAPEMAHQAREPFAQSAKHRALMVLQSMVEDGVAAGVLRPDLAPDLAARSLWAGCHGLASLMAHLPSFPTLDGEDPSIPPDDFIAFHADQMMRGLELAPAAAEMPVSND